MDAKDDQYTSSEEESTATAKATEAAELDEKTRQARSAHRERHYLFNKTWGDFLMIFNGDIFNATAAIGPRYADPDADEPAHSMQMSLLKAEGIRLIAMLIFRGLPCGPCHGK